MSNILSSLKKYVKTENYGVNIKRIESQIGIGYNVNNNI